jgi:hypothetical protein
MELALGNARLQRLSTYHDYQQHMTFLRAALNRVLNTMDTLTPVETAPTVLPTRTRERIETAVCKCYTAQYTAGTQMVQDMRVFLNTPEPDADVLSVGIRMMNKFNRSTVRVASKFEADIHPMRPSFDDNSKDRQIVDNPDMLAWRTNYDAFISELETRTEYTITKFKDEPDLFWVSSLAYVMVHVPSSVNMVIDEDVVWGVFPKQEGTVKVVVKKALCQSRQPNTVYLWGTDIPRV